MARIAYRIATVAMSMGLACVMVSAQAGNQADRKVIQRVAPVYPELAKRMHITGLVRFEVVIRPDGSVKSMKAVGGNPLLIQSAMDAIRKWKYKPAPEETTGIVELNFDPDQQD